MEKCPDCGEYNSVIYNIEKDEWECWMCGYTISGSLLKIKEENEWLEKLEEEDVLEMASYNL